MNSENQEDKKNSPTWKEEIISWIKIIVTAALIAFVLNTFIIANSKVPSGSMENTIMTGDRVIGLRLTYRFQDPQRGDVAIFRYPDDPSVYYVKRIMGLPGDIIDIREGKVYLNNAETPLEESYIRAAMEVEPDMHFEVPENSYFMMGDNRNESYDSRRWRNSFVARDQMIAKVYFRYYPNISSIK